MGGRSRERGDPLPPFGALSWGPWMLLCPPSPTRFLPATSSLEHPDLLRPHFPALLLCVSHQNPPLPHTFLGVARQEALAADPGGFWEGLSGRNNVLLHKNSPRS